jgi:hypothetical protein
VRDIGFSFQAATGPSRPGNWSAVQAALGRRAELGAQSTTPDLYIEVLQSMKIISKKYVV